MRSLHRVASYRLRFLLGFLPALLAGCTDEKIVFREPFNPPPDNTFLGFFDASTSQTTCGNCHVLHQRDWVNTAHASAISLLVGNGDATPECYQCHTVSERGNPVDGAAGYNSVQTDVYHDVQCESCHGPGLDHVEFPDAGQTATNPPLAAISVPLLSAPLNSTDSATLANSASCGSCHNQNSGPGVRTYEEWASSGHAVAVTEGPDNCAPACNAACAQCHEAKGILAAWGVFANYRDKGSSELLGQTCAVCHDPHGSRKDDSGQPFPGQLRYSMDTPDTNANLCMKCHQRRAVPATTSSRGPHSPQGPMLLGDAGYRPVGFDPNVVQTTHASDANPRLCAGCHVNRLTGTDVTTGRPATSAGHLFLAVPCLDAGGLPDLANQDCPHDEASRSWQACTVCHNSAAQGVSLFTLITQRMDADTREIWTDLNANGLVDPDSTACSAGALRIRVEGEPAVTDTIPCANPTGVTATDDYNRANWDAGLLARTDLIPQIGPTAAFPNDTSEYKTNDSFISPAEGALFNVRMLNPEFGSDGSHGVHNPFLAEALLIANIAEINTRYYGGAAVLSPAVRSKMSSNMAGLYRSVANAALMQSKQSK